ERLDHGLVRQAVERIQRQAPGGHAPGEVLEVAELLARESGSPQPRGAGGSQLARGRRPAAIEGLHAPVNRRRRLAGELLVYDGAGQVVEAGPLGPELV